ncbi:MAG: magnesium transporter [Casimicrobiaceae bacterium]|nr:magnesium transporter [Casimicrobiaceae bacterium]
MNREELAFAVRALARAHDLSVFKQIARQALPSDLIEALESLNDERVAQLLALLDAPARAELFSHFPEERQDALLGHLSATALAELIEWMPSDDRADLFNRLSEEAKAKLLPALAKAEREDIVRLASFPEDTVGAAVTSDYLDVSPEMTVSQALARLRATATEKETVYVIYVLDADRRLRGTVSLRDLVLAPEERKVSELMHADPVFARATWPIAQAAELIRRYDLLALPVIDEADRMLGIVTVDDAMDIDKERDAAQLARFGGGGSIGGPDLDILASPFRTMFGVRVFWLAILTVFGILTSSFVAAQEEILSKVIVLAAFIAPIVDMGGNTGSQSATLVIRAMALGEVSVRWRDIWTVIQRELPVAVALGLTIAILEAILAYFSKGVGGGVLMVVGLSMLACTALGGIIGALLPFAARRIGTDPATLSSPLITSIMDLLGVFIYFGFAWMFLGDQLRSAA